MSSPDLSTILARLNRHRPEEIEGGGVWRKAAVALLLHDPREGELETLFIRRTQRADDPWSGHMALPGGRHEDGDQDLEATARRETFEEVGVQLGPAVGRLDDTDGAYGRKALVAPHVFVVESLPELTLDQREVADALWIPLAWFHDERSFARHVHERDGVRRSFPATAYEGCVIWGLTYRVISAFFDVVGSPMPAVEPTRRE